MLILLFSGAAILSARARALLEGAFAEGSARFADLAATYSARDWLAGLAVICCGVFAAAVALQALSSSRLTHRMRKAYATAARARARSGRVNDADVIVVGGGCAGCAAAVRLADQGKRVVVVERDMSLQDRIVGELMQPGGVRALKEMGLDDCLHHPHVDGVRVDGYAVIPTDVRPEQGLLLQYPVKAPETAAEEAGFIKAGGRGKGGPKGVAFHNGLFVQALRERVLRHENIDVVDGTVLHLVHASDETAAGEVVGKAIKKQQQQRGADPVLGVSVRVGKADDAVVRELRAPLTLCCDGLWSGLRANFTDSKPVPCSTAVGILLKHAAHESPLPFHNNGHVFLGDPSPILLYQISPTETRVLVDIVGKAPRASTGALSAYLKRNVAAQLPPALRAATEAAVDAGEVHAMPTRYLFGRHSSFLPGAASLGDALNMRHPLTGGGMTVGLCDVELFTRLCAGADLGDYAAMARVEQDFREQRKGHAATINTLANALHAVFTTPGRDPTRMALRDACYAYLCKGSAFSMGPVGLLCGLTHNPLVLSTHFFLVALYASARLLLPCPTPGRVLRLWGVLHTACVIILPLLREERATPLQSWPLRKAANLFFRWEGRQISYDHVVA